LHSSVSNNGLIVQSLGVGINKKKQKYENITIETPLRRNVCAWALGVAPPTIHRPPKIKSNAKYSLKRSQRLCTALVSHTHTHTYTPKHTHTDTPTYICIV